MSNKTAFTEAETKIVISMIQNMRGDIETNFAAVATECGLKDARSAKARWSQIKRNKITLAATSATPAGGVGKKTCGKARASKSKPALDADDDDSPSPPKSRRGEKAKGKARFYPKVIEDEFEDYDEAVLFKGLREQEKKEEIDDDVDATDILS